MKKNAYFLFLFLFLLLGQVGFGQEVTYEEASKCWKDVKSYFFIFGQTPTDEKTMDCMKQSYDFFLENRSQYPMEYGEMIYYRAYQFFINNDATEVELITNSGIEFLENIEESMTRDSLFGDLYGLQNLIYTNLLFDFDKALTTLQFSESYYEKTGQNMGRLLSKINYIATYHQFGFCELARESLDSARIFLPIVVEEDVKIKALKPFVESAIETQEAMVLLCESITLLNQGEFEMVAERAKKARVIFKNTIPRILVTMHPTSLVQAYANLGSTFLVDYPVDEMKMDSALYYYEKALSISRAKKVDLVSIETSINLIKFYKTESIEYLNKAESLFESMGIDLNQKDSLSRFEILPKSSVETAPSVRLLAFKSIILVGVYMKTGDLAYLKKIVDDQEVLIRLGNSLRVLNADDKSMGVLNEYLYFTFAKGVWAAAELSNITGQEVDFEKAFEFSQRSKDYVLKQAIYRNYSTKDNTELAYRKELKELSGKYRRTELGSDENLKSLQELASLKQEFWSYIKELAKEDKTYFNSRFGLNYKTVEDVKANLDEHSAILDIKHSIDSTIVFIITKEKNELIFLPSIKKFDNEVKKYINFLNNSSDNFESISHKLYKQIFAPIINHLPSGIKHLMISPDQKWWEINYDSFVIQEDRDKTVYLIDSFSVTYLYTYEGLSNNQVFTPEVGSNFVNIFTSNYEKVNGSVLNQFNCDLKGGFLNLTNLTNSAIDLVTRINHSSLHKSSTKDNFIDYADNSTISVLIAHGCVDEKKMSPMDYGIIFTPEEDEKEFVLRLSDIYQLQLEEIKLLFLASCNTGWGALKQGAGLPSIARGFFYAGCPSLIAGLDQVPDEGTSLIMEEFFDNILRGYLIREALQRAKISLAHREELHPSDWANIICLGQGNITFRND